MSNFTSSGPRSRALLVLVQAALVSASTGAQVPLSCGVKGPDHTTWEDEATGRIVNGQDATECEWKWQAALVRRSDGYHFCGGTLISDRWVLTAAHCMIYSFDILLGSFKRDKVDSNEFQVGVKQVITHPSYNDESWDYDFALVELQSSAPIGACIDVACLPEEDIAQGDDCMITGWGKLESGGSFANKMQEAMVQIVGHDDCDARMPRTVTDRMVCGQGELSNGEVTDACHGDSGGPLVCRNAQGAYTLHGASSWGYGCASPSFPGVWARVFAVRGWIDQQIGGATQSATPAPATPPLAGGVLARCFMPAGTDSAGCFKVYSGKFVYYEMSLDESSPSGWTLMFSANFGSLKNHRCAVGFGKECLAKGRDLKSTACKPGSGWNDWAVLVDGGKGRLYCNGQMIREVGYPAGLSVPQKCAFIVGGSSNNQCSKITTGAKLGVRSMVLHQGNALLSPGLALLAAGASARCSVIGMADLANQCSMVSGTWHFFKLELGAVTSTNWKLVFEANIDELKSNTPLVSFGPGDKWILKGSSLKQVNSCKAGSGWHLWELVLASGKATLRCDGVDATKYNLPGGYSVPASCSFLIGGRYKKWNSCSKTAAGGKFEVRNMVLVEM